MRSRKCREDKEPKDFRIMDRRFVIRAKVCRQCENSSSEAKRGKLLISSEPTSTSNA